MYTYRSNDDNRKLISEYNETIEFIFTGFRISLFTPYDIGCKLIHLIFLKQDYRILTYNSDPYNIVFYSHYKNYLTERERINKNDYKI